MYLIQCIRSCGKSPGSFPSGLMNVTISRPKLNLILIFACNTDLWPNKLVAWSIIDNFFYFKTNKNCKLCYQCFFRKIEENYARNDELCQNSCWQKSKPNPGGTLKRKDISYLNDVISLFFLPLCVVCHPARCFFYYATISFKGSTRRFPPPPPPPKKHVGMEAKKDAI